MTTAALQVRATTRTQRQAALEPVRFALGAVVPKLQVTATPTTGVRVAARSEAV